MSPGNEQSAGAAPLVSVLMSVYNGAAYLQQSIESILSQTLEDFEFIIIDDGSSDCSGEIIKAAASRDSRVRAFSNPGNLGLSRSLNRGLALARGVYIARQDADDVSAPERLAEQVALLVADRSLVLTGSAYWVMDSYGVLLRMEQPPLHDALIRWRMLFNSAFAHPTVIFRADLLARHQLQYDEKLRYAQDYDLWSRFTDYGPVANGAAPLVYYRVYDETRRTEMHRQQQDIASGVVKRNLTKLGVALSDHEVHLLREFDSGRPLAGGDNLHCQRLVLQIMHRFGKANPGAVAKLGRTRIRLVMGAWRLLNSGASCLDLVRLSWGYFWLGPISFVKAVLAALFSNVFEKFDRCYRCFFGVPKA